jgi:anti-sigma-K factor RskA
MDNNIDELLAFYALGALTDEEREQVEAYLAEHPEAQAQVKELELAAAALPYGVPPIEPSDQTKKELMARVTADQRIRSTHRSTASRRAVSRSESRSGVFAPFAFSAVSLVIAAFAVIFMLSLNRQVSNLQSEVAVLRNALVAQENTVKQLNEAIEQVNAKLPQATPQRLLTTFTIKGTTAQPNAHAQLMTDPNSQSAVLVVSGLEPLPAGKTYQIWLIEGDTPKSAGLLKVDASGAGVSILTPQETISSFHALGVSIEPEKGSAQPTGDIVLLGEFD